MGEEGVRDRGRPDEPAPPSDVVPSAFAARYRDAIDERLRGPAEYDPLFSPLQVFVATLMFSTLGGSALIASNCRRLGNPLRAGLYALLGLALAPVAPSLLAYDGARFDLALFGAVALWFFPAVVAGFFVHVNHVPVTAAGDPLRERSWGWALLFPFLWSMAALFVVVSGLALLALGAVA